MHECAVEAYTIHGLDRSRAESLLHDLIALPLTVYSATNGLQRALQLGLKHQLAIYDSVYVALVEQLNHPLITDDGRQAKAAAAEDITLKPITDFK